MTEGTKAAEETADESDAEAPHGVPKTPWPPAEAAKMPMRDHSNRRISRIKISLAETDYERLL